MKITKEALKKLIKEAMMEEEDPTRGTKELIKQALKHVEDTIERQAPTGMTVKLNQEQFVAMVEEVLRNY
jgi:MoaA/NifB/PqqE/SkfB family radical SAM enzyme